MWGGEEEASESLPLEYILRQFQEEQPSRAPGTEEPGIPKLLDKWRRGNRTGTMCKSYKEALRKSSQLDFHKRMRNWRSPVMMWAAILVVTAVSSNQKYLTSAIQFLDLDLTHPLEGWSESLGLRIARKSLCGSGYL